MSTEQRFIDLETKISHQEFLLEELNQVLYEQQKIIDILQTKITSLTKRLDDSGVSGTDIRQHNEKPPHY